MACPLSYIHVVVPINISGLSQSIHHFRNNVHQLQKGYNEKEQKAMLLEKQGQLKSDGSIFFQINHLLDLMLKEADNLKGSLDSLLASLPRIEDTSMSSSQSHNFWVKQHPAVLIATTALSRIFSMLKGWFMHQPLGPDRRSPQPRTPVAPGPTGNLDPA